MSAADLIDIEAEVVVVEMTESCARDLTERINSASEDLAGMLQRAHDEKAWQALGYPDWKSYIRAEIKMSERHAFRMLDFAEIRDDISTDQLVSPPVTESVLRPLKKIEPAKRAEVYAIAVEKAGGEQPTAKQVEEAVIEVLDPEPKIVALFTPPPVEPSDAMVIAKRAVSLLADIPTDDSHFPDAIKFVEAWCQRRKKEIPHPLKDVPRTKINRWEAESMITDIVVQTVLPIFGDAAEEHFDKKAIQKISDDAARLLATWISAAEVTVRKETGK